MAEPAVIHDDLELFLTTWYRNALAARDEPYADGVVVDVDESDDPRQVIIRADSGTTTSVLTAERDVGISILAGTKESPKDANDLALLVHALASQIPAVEPGNPVSAVLRSTLPVSVIESQPKARRYFTLTLAVTGTPL